MDQTAATLLGTAVIVSFGVLFSNSRVGDITEGVLDARVRHVEEKLRIR